MSKRNTQLLQQLRSEGNKYHNSRPRAQDLISIALPARGMPPVLVQTARAKLASPHPPAAAAVTTDRRAR